MTTFEHRTLAHHFYLDALDLRSRHFAHWESQPRKSSRVKSFIDLLMALECILKAQLIMGKRDIPLSQVYLDIKKYGHNIEKMSQAADTVFPMLVHARAKRQFRKFKVSLRYSVDAHQCFFPFPEQSSKKILDYSSTLGNTTWMNESRAIVSELVEWGTGQFAGEVTDDVEIIFQNESLLYRAINTPSK